MGRPMTDVVGGALHAGVACSSIQLCYRCDICMLSRSSSHCSRLAYCQYWNSMVKFVLKWWSESMLRCGQQCRGFVTLCNQPGQSRQLLSSLTLLDGLRLNPGVWRSPAVSSLLW
jgi:hypothetical protein